MTQTKSYFIRPFYKETLKPPREWPLDSVPWSQLRLKYNGQLDLEIGCGVGQHPLLWAHQHPERYLIAIERTQEKYTKFANASDKAALANLLPVHADAIPWVSLLVPDETFENIFILYPNPNPKNKSQRFFRMPFFQEILRVLKPKGFIHLATNIVDYHKEAQEFGEKAWGLQQIQSLELNAANYGEYFPEFANLARTHFEKKYLARGETCFHLLLQK